MAQQDVSKKESNKILIASLIIIILFVAALLTNGFGIKNLFKKPINIEIGDSPVLGTQEAPVTIFIFSDFSCPICAAANNENEEAISYLKQKDPEWEAPIPSIIRNYVNSGQVKLVFKYFPGHDSRAKAHLVAWCLNDQAKFWEFHDLAFKNQENATDLQAMLSLAQGIGADMTALESCINSGKYNYMFSKDEAQGTQAGIKGTPTFVVGNKIIEGAESYDVFNKEIKKLL